MKTVQDIMTNKVVSINPDISMVEAVNVLLKNGFNGLPVIDKDQKLVGIITEYDLVIKGSSVYLPTFIKFFKELDLYKKDKKLIKKDFEAILNTKVQDAMNRDPLTIFEDASLEEAVKTFGEHHKVNPIPVLSRENKVVGIISRSDMIKFFRVPSLENTGPIDSTDQRELDKKVNLFLKHLESQFVLVKKSRTRLWLAASILFAVVGYIIAWALIIRIDS